MEEYLTKIKSILHEAAENLGDEEYVKFLDAVDEEVEERRPEETGGEDDDEDEDEEFEDDFEEDDEWPPRAIVQVVRDRRTWPDTAPESRGVVGWNGTGKPARRCTTGIYDPCCVVRSHGWLLAEQRCCNPTLGSGGR